MTAWRLPAPPRDALPWNGIPKQDSLRDGLHLILFGEDVHAPMWRAGRREWVFGPWAAEPRELVRRLPGPVNYIGPLQNLIRAIAAGTASAYYSQLRDKIADGLGLDLGPGASEEDRRARGYGLRFAELVRDIPDPAPDSLERIADGLVSELLPMLLLSNLSRRPR